MSKRDDDSQADFEVGMTTAERRRRRRRGGGLRVPSDNVPRRATTPPVVAPVPEDPSLAMSIAYSFGNEPSEPVPRVELRPSSPSTSPIVVPAASDPNLAARPDPVAPEPVAPDAMQTVIDPPSAPVESADFEMKTREMSAVDLEALGLQDVAPRDGGDAAAATPPPTPAVVRAPTQPPAPPTPPPAPPAPPAPPPVEVDIEMNTPPPGPPPSPPEGAAVKRDRLKTQALSEEDLEEMREAVRAIDSAAVEQAPWLPTRTSEPMSVPEIDIQLLAERSSDTSHEFEVDIDNDVVKAARRVVQSTPPAPAHPPPTPAAAAQPPPPPAEARRPSSSSVPPPNAPAAQPPPTPPAAAPHKPPPAPPAPPAAKKEPKPPAPSAAKLEPKAPPRGKPWFVDLFDEDYLRTLPFLTPQATQAEAEFVVNAMGLTPGAQVLDVGCGYGRHAMELAARGFHVVGLDLSTPLLVRGGEEAHRRGLQINFVRGDMRELDFEAQFDGAYCLFSTFGYFDDETNKKTVANIARALKPGGRMLIEILNRDYVIADLPTRVWWEGEGCVVLEEVELNYFSSRIQVNRSVVFDDGRQLEQEISVRAYSLHEVGKLMHAAGFRVLEVSGGYQTRGRFFGNQSRHIIVLAERKDAS